MNFSECIIEVSQHLKTAQARLLERSFQGEGDFESWWLTFTRSGCLYRITFVGKTCALTLEKGQGSFVVGSKTKWISVNSTQIPEGTFEAAVVGVQRLLERFTPETASSLPAGK